MLNFLRLGENLPTSLSREYWHFILAFSVEFFLSFTTLRCLYAAYNMRICVSIFNICILDFHFSNSEKKLYSYLQRELNQNPEIGITNSSFE